MYSVLGWINVALTALLILPYVMRIFNQAVLKKKSGVFVKIQKLLRKSHRYIGILLVISVLAHGWFALRGLRLHTGTVAGIAVLITASFGATFWITKKKWAFKTHKALAIAFITLMLLHLIIPSALYYIF